MSRHPRLNRISPPRKFTSRNQVLFDLWKRDVVFRGSVNELWVDFIVFRLRERVEILFKNVAIQQDGEIWITIKIL
jgi:hypothetical protein